LTEKKYSRRSADTREIPGGKEKAELTASWAKHTIDANLKQRE
jgi:hypothetical protein